MPSQGNELVILRRRTGDTETTLPDEDAEILIDEAKTQYPDYSRIVILQAAIVARIEELIVQASKSVTYQMNEERENLSDTAKVLEGLLKTHKAKLDVLLADERPIAVAMGTTRRVPRRCKDVP